MTWKKNRTIDWSNENREIETQSGQLLFVFSIDKAHVWFRISTKKITDQKYKNKNTDMKEKLLGWLAKFNVKESLMFYFRNHNWRPDEDANLRVGFFFCRYPFIKADYYLKCHEYLLQLIYKSFYFMVPNKSSSGPYKCCHNVYLSVSMSIKAFLACKRRNSEIGQRIKFTINN